MEGKHTPPFASHPYPNNPDMWKFWGTPFVKSYFKVMGTMTLCFVSFIAMSVITNRNEVGTLGIDYRMTAEQVKKKIAMIKNSHTVFMTGFNMTSEYQDINLSTDDHRFDDGISFVTPTLKKCPEPNMT